MDLNGLGREEDGYGRSTCASRASSRRAAGAACDTAGCESSGDAPEPGQADRAYPSPGFRRSRTMEGKFVRASYNNEGLRDPRIPGHQPFGGRRMDAPRGRHDAARQHAGLSVDPRGAISLETPDGKTIPLPSITEQRERKRQRDPAAGEGPARFHQLLSDERAAGRARSCSFPTWDLAALPYDVVDLSNDRACLGRLYFRIPGGIAYGQHWLNVKFQNSLVRVPFRILTKDEEQLFSKNYKSIEKQVKEAFRDEVAAGRLTSASCAKGGRPCARTLVLAAGAYLLAGSASTLRAQSL